MIEVTADWRNSQLVDKLRESAGAEIIGESGALKRVLSQVETVAATSSTVHSRKKDWIQISIIV